VSVRPVDLPYVDGVLTADEVAATVESIARMQEPAGGIPWYAGPGSWVDPWDHVECAMALAAGGRYDAAERAYAWLRTRQRPDGSWPAKYVRDRVVDAMVDTNQCAYVAVGAWHFWLLTRDEAFVSRMWRHVRRALDFVVSMQTARGEILWCVGADGMPGDYALLAGSSSMVQSLRCGLALADLLAEPQPEWELAVGQLAHVVAEHPEAFEPKDRYAMDWYYPILDGPVRGDDALRRLAQRWDEFVVPGLGVRCVDDGGPWVTGAETCELVLALDAVGERGRALEQFAAMQHLRDSSGGYWTGLLLPTGVRWPAYTSSWTAAAAVLAADALSRVTPGSGIFRADDLPVGAALLDAPCDCPLSLEDPGCAAPVDAH
jgi:hypothetical protein